MSGSTNMAWYKHITSVTSRYYYGSMLARD